MRSLSHAIGGIAIAAGAISSTADILLAIGAIIGAKAPDWLEMPQRLLGNIRVGLLPHRTITHLLEFWSISLALSLWQTEFELRALLVGFFAAGLVHVVQDACTPIGVPTLFAKKRLSFHLVNGLTSELIVNTMLTPVLFLLGFILATP